MYDNTIFKVSQSVLTENSKTLFHSFADILFWNAHPEAWVLLRSRMTAAGAQ